MIQEPTRQSQTIWEVIAAGQEASAAQAIHRDLFEEALPTHSLRRYTDIQLQGRTTEPVIRDE